jgi:hypothetical protein
MDVGYAFEVVSCVFLLAGYSLRLIHLLIS